MAFVFLESDIIKTGVGQTVSDSVNVVMPEDVQIVSTNNDALRQTGGTGVFSLAGDLYAEKDALELLGTATVTLEATSVLFGGAFGIRATLALDLTNAGSISGGNLGLRAVDDLTLVNLGTLKGLEAQSGADIYNESGGRITGTVSITGVAGDTVSLVNDGTIGHGGIEIETDSKVTLDNGGIIRGDVTIDLAGNRAAHVTNSGHIGGDLALGRGDDTYDGRGGTVSGSVIGGRGDDTYILDDATLSIVEGAAANGGSDTIFSSVDYGLNIAANVETLVLTGGASLRGIGADGDDSIVGNSGGNRISGLDGKDTLIGGSGGDSLRGGRGGDRLEGGSEEDLLVGAAGRDTLFGGTGDDTLLGGGLHDVISGGDGNDAINGGFGNDTIIAGRGLDDMTGSFGNDTFRFEDITIWEATEEDDDVARPIVSDFRQGADAIDLTAINANGRGSNTAFTFLGTNEEFTGKRGELRADTTITAGRTVLQGDVDGDGVADLDIDLLGTFLLEGTDILL